MLANWLHILVVHIPGALLPAGLIFYIYALINQSKRSFQIAAVFILTAALFAMAAYWSGGPAQEWLEQLNIMRRELIEQHALWGRISFTLMIVGGAGSLVVLVNYAQEAPPAKWLHFANLTIAFLSLLSLLYTSHLGGMIRRPDFVF
jgi:uncharacterized membrane protein